MESLKNKLTYLFFVFITLIYNSNSQNIEKINKKDILKISGSLNCNTIFLITNNPNSKRTPLTNYTSGNLNLNFLYWNFPFTYQISNQSKTFSQPFNQLGVTPTYKWIKLHGGWSNINFSQYTLSGYPFLGVGAELSPKNWKIQILYGQFKKTINYNFENENNKSLAYKRIGAGAKIGFEKNGYAFYGIFFKAKDILNSINYLPENSLVQPQEGSVISLQSKVPIFKQLHIEGEYALSGLTRNITSQLKETNQKQNNYTDIFITQKTSTEFYSAYKTSLSYNQKLFVIAANYERIAPSYVTLGAYYFNNDYENITLSPQINLLKSKLNISLNGGIQRNNIDNKKLNTTNRLIGSGNLNFSPSNHWIFNFSYSNFTSYTRNRPVNNPFYIAGPQDTMNFYQVSQCGNLVASYNFTKRNYRNTISINANNLNSAQAISNVFAPETKIYNLNFVYSLTEIQKKLTVNLTMNTNKSIGYNINTLFYGPGFNLSKVFLKNGLTISLGNIINLGYENNLNSKLIFNQRLNVNYLPKMKQKNLGKPSLNFFINYVNQPKLISNGYMLSEFTGNLSLGYGF